MRTTEYQLAQIFDRKNKFVDQIKQQSLQFDQLLAYKLLIRSISPPPWLSVPNGSCIPHSQPAILCSSSHFPLCHGNQQDVNVYHSELPNDTCVEFRASNVGLDAGEEQSVLPQCVADNAVDALGPVPEQDTGVVSLHHQKDARNSGIFQGQAQSLVKIQRSKSRQRAFEERNSVKTDKSSFRDENLAITGAITCSEIALLQSDDPNVSEFLQAVDNSSERSSVEGQTDDCGGKDGNVSISFGKVARSKSLGNQSKSIKEVLCGHNSSDVAHQQGESPNSFSNYYKKSGGEDQLSYKGKGKESSVSGRIKGWRSSNLEPDNVIESSKNNSIFSSEKEIDATRSAQEPNHVSNIDELVRPSLSPVGEPILEGRDGTENLSFTYKHPVVITTVGSSHCKSNSRKRIMRPHDSAKTGTSNEKSGNMNSGRHKQSKIFGRKPSCANDTENKGSSQSIANGNYLRLEHVDVLLEQNSRKSSMLHQESANAGISIEKSGNSYSSSHKQSRTSGQQPTSVEETKHEGSSPFKEDDSRLEHYDMLLELLKPTDSNENCIVEEARKGDLGSKDRGGNFSYRMPRDESSILPPDCLEQSTNQYDELQKSIVGKKKYFLSKQKDAKCSRRITRSSSSAHKCNYVGTVGYLINDENDSTGTLSQSNVCIEVLNPSPHFSESYRVEKAEVEDCRSMKKESDASCRISRAKSSRLCCDSVNDSLKNNSFLIKGKEDPICESIEEPENASKLKRLIEENIERCPSKENCSNVYRGRITRSRNFRKKPSSAKAILDVGTSYVACESDHTLASSASESIKASKKVNESLKQLNLFSSSNDNNGVREVAAKECKMTEKEINTSASVTSSGISGICLRESLQVTNIIGDVKEKTEDTINQCRSKENCGSASISIMTRSTTTTNPPTSAKEAMKDDNSNGFLKNCKEIVQGSPLEDLKFFGILKESVEEKVGQPCSEKRVSSGISGRITRSRTSCSQSTFVQEILNVDNSSVVNDHTSSRLHGETIQPSYGVDKLVDLTLSNQLIGLEVIDDGRKNSEMISLCIWRKSESSSLQFDHVNDIVKTVGFTSNDKQDVGNEISVEPNHVTEYNKLARDSYSPKDMVLLEEKEESTNPLLASIPIDMVTGNYDTVPVYESFVMNSDDQKQISGNGICLEKMDIPDATLSRACFVEQLCKSARLPIPISPDSITYTMHERQSLHQSVPDELLGSAASSSLCMNKVVEQNTSVDHSSLNKDDGTSYSYSLPLSNFESSWDVKKPCTSPVKKAWDSILSISGSSEKKKSFNLDLPCITEEYDNTDAVADTLQEEIDSDAPIKSARRNPLADITEEVIEVTNAARSSMDSVNTDFNFQGTPTKVKRKLTNQSGNWKGSTRVRNNQITSKAKVKRTTCLLNGRPSKTEGLGKRSLRGVSSYSGKCPQPNNIVSNVTSFIPLVQQKQPTGVPPGNRDVKVKALEAAEAAKLLAEKKENERKLRKEALKLERVRKERENLRQLELKKKKKEEEWKKKDAEMAARKRQREVDEETKEEERKAKRLEEAKKRLRVHEQKIGGEKRAGKLLRVEEELGDQKGDFMSDNGLMTFGGSNVDASQSIVENHLEVISNAVTINENVVTNSVKEPSYEMSPYQPSDNEEDDDVPNRKFIPSWASKSGLSISVFSQQSIDPDVIFPYGSFSNIVKVCLPRKFQQL